MICNKEGVMQCVLAMVGVTRGDVGHWGPCEPRKLGVITASPSTSTSTNTPAPNYCVSCDPQLLW